MMKAPSWLAKRRASVRPFTWKKVVSTPVPAPRVSSPPRPSILPPRASVVPPSRTSFVPPPLMAALEGELGDVRAQLEQTTLELEEAMRALESARAEIAALQEEARAARESVSSFAAATLDDAERELCELATAIARRVVGRELSLDATLLVAWVREAIATSSLGDRLAVALAPDVHARVPGPAWQELAPSVVVDPTLPNGTCEVRGDATTVSTSAEERISLVIDEAGLGGDREAA